MVNYKFSLGIHDKDGSLLAKQILFSEWTMVDKDDGEDGNKINPKIKEEICRALTEHIEDSITQELINDLITSADEAWVE